MIGTQLFGAVDKVSGHPIVTSFIIVGPIMFPDKSYYLDAQRAPVLESPLLLLPVYSETSVRALPIARLNAKSIACGYVRALAVLGLIIGIVIAIISYAQTPAQRARGMDLLIVAGAIAALLVVSGGVSYLFGRNGSKRDVNIREMCNPVLALAADPAQLEQPLALEISMAAQKSLKESGWNDWLERLLRGERPPAELLPLMLVALRSRAPTYANERAQIETLTDKILAERT